MIVAIRKMIKSISFITFIFAFIIGTFNLDVQALTINQNEKLIERISKDFSKKFCNGIGFGLSKESAMNFAMKENIAIFKNKKGVEDIDNKVMAEKITLSVVDKCGYELNITEEEWASNFNQS